MIARSEPAPKAQMAGRCELSWCMGREATRARSGRAPVRGVGCSPGSSPRPILLAGPLAEPLRPIRPPGAVIGFRAGAPGVEVFAGVGVADPVAVLLLVRMVHDAGDVAGLRQHEAAAALQARQAFERGGPRRDVVLLAGDDVVRDLDVIEAELDALDLEFAAGEGVVAIEIGQVFLRHALGQAGRVLVPEQQVEFRTRLRRAGRPSRPGRRRDRSGADS